MLFSTLAGSGNLQSSCIRWRSQNTLGQLLGSRGIYLVASPDPLSDDAPLVVAARSFALNAAQPRPLHVDPISRVIAVLSGLRECGTHLACDTLLSPECGGNGDGCDSGPARSSSKGGVAVEGFSPVATTGAAVELKSFRDLDLSIHVVDDMPLEVLTVSDDVKMLSYYPKYGRFNNQRRYLYTALAMARALNRTLLIPWFDATDQVCAC